MRYYCDYCDMYLPHGSSTSRRQHNYGWKHRANYKAYYQNIYVKQQREILDSQRHLLPPQMIQDIEREIMQLQPLPPAIPQVGAPFQTRFS